MGLSEVTDAVCLVVSEERSEVASIVGGKVALWNQPEALQAQLKEWLGGMAGMAGMDLILYAVIIMIISAREPRGVWGIVERWRRRKRI